MTAGCGPLPAGNRRSPNCSGSLPYGMRASALGGGSRRISWLIKEAVAARLTSDRRVKAYFTNKFLVARFSVLVAALERATNIRTRNQELETRICPMAMS